MGELKWRLRSVLIVDDDERILFMLQRAFEGRGIEAALARNRREAVNQIVDTDPDVALIDLQLGADSGLDVLRDLTALHRRTKLIMMSAYGSIASAVEAVRLGASDFLEKPFTLSELLLRIHSHSAPDSDAFATLSAERALWEHVHRVLIDAGGNKSLAARRLRKPRSWLRRFLARSAPA